ncbi:MAG: glycosyltransferase family 2 protein [Pseudomonadota bacterium]|nr:glycosyltransferase family 2 protein [Pseudomonadota bacterium]
MTRLSLITTAYNSARTIADTLRSVNAQTLPDFEYLIVDGGSKDETMEIVAREGRRVTSAVSERDGGIYDAYNKGLARATGDVIGFLNSDDFYASDTVLAEVMAAFEDPEVDAVYGDLTYVDPVDTGVIERVWRSRPPTRANIARGFHPAHPTLFLRRRVYDRAGVFNLDYRLAGDVEYMMRIFHTLDLKAVHLPGIMVRMRSGGATGGDFASLMRQNREVRRAQHALGIRYPVVGFALHKVVDRVQQRLRGRAARG